MTSKNSSQRLAVLDLGGQYCHLISRTLGDLGIGADVLTPNTSTARLRKYAGVILSGGPNSVYDGNAPRVRADLLKLGKPMLGICYGHQLLAQTLGGTVEPGHKEYGPSRLRVAAPNGLFAGMPEEQTVWMSHSDSVSRLPAGVRTLAATERCEAAAFAAVDKRIYAVQFHPEVRHTRFGGKLLENFGVDICGIEPKPIDATSVENVLAAIREQVGDGSVFFLVSGGVDSMVAFALCAKALGKERVRGIHVDTGLMPLGESEELLHNLEHLGLSEAVLIRRESNRFFHALKDTIDPEEKRRIIGRLFVEIQDEATREFHVDDRNWFLGQGTIYPDTIESGGAGGRAAVIKTHHNRCAEIQHLIDRGRVVEPLSEFYKDQVRQIGARLGLRSDLLGRWPFPGPGLAIRVLCSEADSLNASAYQGEIALGDYAAHEIPLRTVGVQGDSRTYRRIVAIEGALDYEALQAISSAFCNLSTRFNRAIALIGSRGHSLSLASIKPNQRITKSRVALLQEADLITRRVLASEGLTDSVWQFPVVLVPISGANGESVVLRPVDSTDGMTASFARLEPRVIQAVSDAILTALPAIDYVFLDVTNKPPATIEWE